jgi:hypothetical protein
LSWRAAAAKLPFSTTLTNDSMDEKRSMAVLLTWVWWLHSPSRP